MDTKTVVQGGYGPVPMEENGRRYIDAEPVTIPMTGYYLRRMMSGELIEWIEEVSITEAGIDFLASKAVSSSTPPAPAPAVESPTASFDLSEKEGA